MLTIDAPAKLNLGLNVIGQRSDGYHLLDTIFIMVDLCDRITLKTLDDDQIIIKCAHPKVPEDHNNIVWKAANYLKQAYNIKQGVEIEIEKHIPVGGGMAGGSTDAAAVLRALPLLWDIEINEQKIVEIAKKLGADVLYCYVGGVKRGQGIGHDLESIDNTCSLRFAVLPQPYPSNTAQVFALWDKLEPKEYIDISMLVQALASGNLTDFSAGLGNSLESAILAHNPMLSDIITMLRKKGFFAFFTGSGSTIYVLLNQENDIIKLQNTYYGSIIECKVVQQLFEVKTI